MIFPLVLPWVCSRGLGRRGRRLRVGIGPAPGMAVLSASAPGLMECVRGLRAGLGGELLTCQAWGSGM